MKKDIVWAACNGAIDEANRRLNNKSKRCAYIGITRKYFMSNNYYYNYVIQQIVEHIF